MTTINIKTVFLVLLLLALGGMVGYVIRPAISSLIPSPSANKSTHDAFAQCLTQKGVTMYGADWCPHCQNEKRAFGDSFRFVNYVECTKDPNRCTEQKVGGFPTWIFPDGQRFEGEQGLANLAKASGCRLEQ